MDYLRYLLLAVNPLAWPKQEPVPVPAATASARPQAGAIADREQGPTGLLFPLISLLHTCELYLPRFPRQKAFHRQAHFRSRRMYHFNCD